MGSLFYRNELYLKLQIKFKMFLFSVLDYSVCYLVMFTMSNRDRIALILTKYMPFFVMI